MNNTLVLPADDVAERDNQHRLQGYTTLRFGWAEVTGDPCAVAAQV